MEITKDNIERFWAAANKQDGCWLWGNTLSANGYGRMTVSGVRIRAHRFAYELLVGPIPHGLQIDHLCRNRACVNPAHMEPVSQKENMRRGISGLRNKVKTHCPAGHEYSAENTSIYRGFRKCKSCIRERSARRWKDDPGGEKKRLSKYKK